MCSLSVSHERVWSLSHTPQVSFLARASPLRYSFLCIRWALPKISLVLLVKKPGVKSCWLRTVKVRSNAHYQNTPTGMPLDKYGRRNVHNRIKRPRGYECLAFFHALLAFILYLIHPSTSKNCGQRDIN